MNDNYQDWLDSLRVGDKVALNFGNSSFIITTINKITPTRRMGTDYGSHKFSSNGYEISNKESWLTRVSINPVTDIIMEQIKQNELLAAKKKEEIRALFTGLLND